MKHFSYTMTEEDAKKHYRNLALKHHPDKGGSKTVMSEINNEYAALQQYFKQNHLPKMKPGHTGVYREKSESTIYDFETSIEID